MSTFSLRGRRREVDVMVGDWLTKLEEPPQAEKASRRWDIICTGPLRAFRVGMALISGMREAAAQRIMAARAVTAFETIEDMAMRGELDAHKLRCLSGANALATLAGQRPGAVWEATGADTRPTEVLHATRTFEDPVEFADPAKGASIADDYASEGLTLWWHPLALLRGRLAARRVRTVDNLRRRARDCDQVWVIGAVTYRQKPSTASGVIVATLEDKLSRVNIIVWPSIAQSGGRRCAGRRC